MFSISIKRSVASVGVVAGLLAAAAPASAQGGGADLTRLASPGPQIRTSEVFELHTFGSLDPVAHRGGNDTQLAAGGADGLKPDSSTVAVEGLKADSNEVAVEGITLAHEGLRRTPIDELDLSIRGDDTITQAREPAHTVTMLDYIGSP